ncbi:MULTISPECIES: hypothetical protein [unclassified Imperialibacter]|uniref:HD domain-containing protein n=1 Tax=unclassified Imperialibacter TaxID=2629706 RepID=UPI00125794B1|nr:MULTISPECIES: hypothetical protein [unclassified Imperialibacter]CAD5253364.1 Predicted metal-dependent phosphohydrolase, HD superfamily [Imperialibacter sp. 75]CAD5285359.1 Predicted metal-dependent phosphohydrolase, HD superfamily [Imperialibacter sp. 89]VVT23234.1 Predicted metal-dependent phosphohydrolase, HD superfamily [Imperialibacter sp. EC-SDR9]
MKNIRQVWHELAAVYSQNQLLIDKLWQEIENAYSSSGRHYHNLTHIEHMVNQATGCKSQIADFDALLFSIFYHDFVYNTLRNDNEEKSAVAANDALVTLGVPEEKIARCVKQILATKEHTATQDSDTQYLLDIDLAILGESSEIYQTYARAVRKEYAVYPNFVYRKGRRKVIRHFLDMERIFKTDAFHSKYELQAKANLAHELMELSN